MKGLIFLCAICLSLGSANAQEREIRMPEETVHRTNIAEVDRGYWCSIELGGGSTTMEGMRNVAMAGVAFTNGYRFNLYSTVGGAVEVFHYPNIGNVRDPKTHLAMPLFVNARGNILSDEIRRVVPYWSVNVGATLPDGLFLTPGVGLRIGERRSAFLIGINYTFRHLNAQPERTEDYSGVMLKLGYEF